MSAYQAWQDPAHPIPVEYSPAVIERIRRMAFDGLMSLPRVGLGIGGFLLGTRDRDKIVISDLLPISCSHFSGPSFDPTPTEIDAALRTHKSSAPDIIGYYCSRPRREIEFIGRDQVLFFELCPGANRLCLLIRPSATEETRAVLFFRKSSGDIVGTVQRPLIPIEIDEPEPEPAPEPAPRQPAPPPPAPLPPAPPPQPVPPPVTRLPRVEKIPEAPPPTAPPPPPPAPPQPQVFGAPEPLRAPAFATAPPVRNSTWRIIGAVAATLALLVAFWFTRDRWIPRPPLELSTAEIDGHFSVEWNRAAVRGVESGTLTLNDGPATKSFPLNRTQLEAGTYAYKRQTEEVSAVLIAGDTRASARFVAPPKPQPPALPAPEPAAEPATVPATPQK